MVLNYHFSELHRVADSRTVIILMMITTLVQGERRAKLA